ncbi:sulfate adenylyltransferase subunit CysN [Rhizosaccharibacter radicis]|uniref:Multifunctional fusion protein n=1 Tax=Rhizosaccharibacter radicis TaxID=2782605 RepID=A0ABT1VWQ8_9PROT|nr:sulfate adenylyltransferase subunit CysN [Acetobacteraceae bacterium KSS12]
MADATDLPGVPALGDIDAYLEAHRHKSLLRFITCGSVDDGKSTLIGRLLFDSKMIFEDQLAALASDSRRLGTQGQEIDFALLVDGLAAEREQGITIDVAYRFFTTEKRKFIVADTPGHEQYTRNMVTGASTADLAVLLVDARKGILTQTRRHAFLAGLLGIRHLVLAVNKMDLVDWEQDRFDAIVADFAGFGARIGLSAAMAIPMSGLRGDNVTHPGDAAPWYRGPTLLAHLEEVAIDHSGMAERPFRMPVQWVNRPDPSFRGFSGLISAGAVRPGDTIRALPSGRDAIVTRIVTADGDLPSARAGQSVTLTLDREIDISRGDLLADQSRPAPVADQFEATIVWMADEPLLVSRSYWLKLGTRLVPATVTELRHQINVNTLEHLAAKTLQLNAIAICNVALDQPVPFDPYEENRDTGGFILIDRLSNGTVAAGMIRFALRRSENVRWQSLDVDKAARALMNNQVPRVAWFTGFSGAGKSTIANLVEKRLHSLGRRTYILDGDNIRHGLNKDLGFTAGDRVENIRRVAEVARLMVDAGLIVLVSFISPFRAERRLARERLEPGEFVEVFVDTPLADAEKRDVKGLYAKARSGALRNFTGIDSPYERPEHPEIHVDTTREAPDAAAERIVAWLLADAPAAADGNRSPRYTSETGRDPTASGTDEVEGDAP